MASPLRAKHLSLLAWSSLKSVVSLSAPICGLFTEEDPLQTVTTSLKMERPMQQLRTATWHAMATLRSSAVDPTV